MHLYVLVRLSCTCEYPDVNETSVDLKVCLATVGLATVGLATVGRATVGVRADMCIMWMLVHKIGTTTM